MTIIAGEHLDEALARRRNCRYGLRGVRMRHLPTGREFECGGSQWGQDGTLLLYTRRERMRPGHEGKTCGGLVVYTAKELMEGIEPLEPDAIVRAEDCVLLSRWPVVCCRPGRKRERIRPR